MSGYARFSSEVLHLGHFYDDVSFDLWKITIYPVPSYLCYHTTKWLLGSWYVYLKIEHFLIWFQQMELCKYIQYQEIMIPTLLHKSILIALFFNPLFLGCYQRETMCTFSLSLMDNLLWQPNNLLTYLSDRFCLIVLQGNFHLQAIQSFRLQLIFNLFYGTIWCMLYAVEANGIKNKCKFMNIPEFHYKEVLMPIRLNCFKKIEQSVELLKKAFKEQL